MAEGIDDNQSIGWFVQTSARDARGEVQLQAVVQIGDDILGWFWVVGTSEQRGSQGLEKLLTHLKAWAAAATPMSVPSSSFGRRQSAASFLSSFLGGNFSDEMRNLDWS